MRTIDGDIARHAVHRCRVDADARQMIPTPTRADLPPPTHFCADPSGNSIEFKALTKPENLFAKYYVE